MKKLLKKFVKWQPFQGTGMSQLQEFLFIIFVVVFIKILFTFA